MIGGMSEEKKKLPKNSQKNPKKSKRKRANLI
jgi:hypothetical protein